MKTASIFPIWLDTLTNGTDVAIKHTNYLTHNKTFYTIEKIISKFNNIIRTDNYPHEFECGISIHDVWDSQTHVLIPVTQEIKDFIEKRTLECYIDTVDKSELSIEQLREIKRIITLEENPSKKIYV